MRPRAATRSARARDREADPARARSSAGRASSRRGWRLPRGDAAGAPRRAAGPARHGRFRSLLYAARSTPSGPVVVVRPRRRHRADWRPVPDSLILPAWGARIAALLALLAARRIAPPRRPLSHATRALAAGDAAVRVPVEGDDEVAELSASFNAMADRLAAARSRARLPDVRLARAQDAADRHPRLRGGAAGGRGRRPRGRRGARRRSPRACNGSSATCWTSRGSAPGVLGPAGGGRPRRDCVRAHQPLRAAGARSWRRARPSTATAPAPATADPERSAGLSNLVENAAAAHPPPGRPVT